mmetsp:Transcript_11139/g.19484  ORF Transcript_11139/g.19484 Transcript_11139/m.19484 type:complete len:170 (+) Transcript_11139:83-592(+)
MRLVALTLAALACSVCARRVQMTGGRTQGDWIEEQHDLQKAFASYLLAFNPTGAGYGQMARMPLAAHRPAAMASSSFSPRTAPVEMSIFGLGAAELAVIGAVALLILGPDQMKTMAKDIGKMSAELKQVPEEFNKGIATGTEELEKQKKATLQAPAPAKEAPPPPPAAE